jgi:DNA-nicking Smr family endonuclease
MSKGSVNTCGEKSISSVDYRWNIMVNKYQQKPEHILDLHGYTSEESRVLLDSLFRERKYFHVRIITGRGNNSANGPVLPNFVRRYLDGHGARYNQAKLNDGGDGALEVFLK